MQLAQWWQVIRENKASPDCPKRRVAVHGTQRLPCRQHVPNTMNQPQQPYPPIADYAFISDCHCTALISRSGSVDWCCMPRIDSDSCFGRLLDWQRGGYCAIGPVDGETTSGRRYLPGTMILKTNFHSAQGECRLFDFFSMDPKAGEQTHYQTRYDFVRIVEGISGDVDMGAMICPRFDYGEIIPGIRQVAPGLFTAIGSDTGLVLHTDMPLEMVENHALAASFSIHPGQRLRLLMHFEAPERIDHIALHTNLPADVDNSFRYTRDWWQRWSERMRTPKQADIHVRRSALVLKALTYERTGAIVAASTTSLPEWPGEGRNWDYRFSWVRDSVFTVRALYELGYEDEAERFMKFIQRASAGSAAQLQIMYGVDGKRRLSEVELEWLEGYRQSRPVRVGNFAAKQNQFDIYGEILEMASVWDSSGHPIDAQYWNFLADVVDTACHKWQSRDYGIWEFRGGPHHYVHSKAMCWGALARGIALAQKHGFSAPIADWQKTRDQIRDAIEHEGYDAKRGIFVQAFENRYLDAALLLLPRIGFVPYDDPRMTRTTEAICGELDHDGLLARYNSPDGLPGREGVFLPCTFWLVSCLAYQERTDAAWEYYRRALRCANDLGLFSEEFDPKARQMLGNFPQGLTHVSQIMARLALMKTK